RTGAAASRALAAVVGHDRGDAHGVPRVAAAERIGRADAALDRVDLAAAGAVGLAAGAVGVVGLAGGGAQVVAHPAHAHAVPLGVAAVRIECAHAALDGRVVAPAGGVGGAAALVHAPAAAAATGAAV